MHPVSNRHASTDEAQVTWRAKIARSTRRIVKWLLGLMAIYLTIVLVGLIPVHSDFRPSEDGVEVRVISNAVHADLVLPITNEVIDWRTVFPADAFPSDTSDATHIAIGWGDKGFFLLTPTWGDLKFSVVAKALLWPSDTCVHVNMKDEKYTLNKGKSVRISPEQYGQLVDSILESLKLGETGQTIAVTGFHYNHGDAFFEAEGTYHCFNTCNSWVGRKLKAAGVKTPWISPLPKTVYWYFPSA